jgi:tRNA(Ile)-lysidine synthase
MSELLSEHGFGMPQLQSFDFTRVGAQLFAQEYVLSVDRDFIFVNKKENETIISFFPLKLTLEKDFISTPYGVFEWEFIQAQDVEYNRQPHIAFIDFEKLMEPLILDRWQEGDKIQPLGMKGRKKISDILIDQKVPVQQKKQAIVLKSNNEIVWLVGYKFSEVFKVDDNSRKILRIAYYENNESI